MLCQFIGMHGCSLCIGSENVVHSVFLTYLMGSFTDCLLMHSTFTFPFGHDFGLMICPTDAELSGEYYIWFGGGRFPLLGNQIYESSQEHVERLVLIIENCIILYS